MAKKDTYKITIEGPGLNLERSVSKEVCDQVFLLIMTGQTQPGFGIPRDDPGNPPPPPGSLEQGRGVQPDMSIREYIQQRGAKRNTDKIVTIGRYLLNTGKKYFNASDIERQFEAAAEPVPGNLTRDIRDTISFGWIAESTDQKDHYYVTSSGLEVVDQAFPSELMKRKTRKKRTSPKATKKTAKKT